MVASFVEHRSKPLPRFMISIYKEKGGWVACCLQLDLIATGNSYDEVVSDIIDLLKSQLVFAIENDNFQNILRSAPAEEWKRFSKAKKYKTGTIKIEINKKKVASKNQPLKEVELCLA